MSGNAWQRWPRMTACLALARLIRTKVTDIRLSRISCPQPPSANSTALGVFPGLFQQTPIDGSRQNLPFDASLGNGA